MLRRDLFSSRADAVTFSLMTGAGETYFPVFALALGASDVVAGLVTTVPLIAGAILQLISPLAVFRLGSHRRWVVLCAGLQAASFLPLVAGAALGALPVAALFAAVTVYWATGMATGPTWNTWIESLIPASLRTRFLAHRSRLAHAALFAGMVAGAVALGLGDRADVLFPTFAVLFAAAAGFRATSTWFLSRHSEPQPVPPGFRIIPWRELVSDGRRRPDAHLLAHFLCVQIAVYVAAPYFTPYMLGPLGLSYPQFMVLTGASFAAKVLLLPAFGGFAYRFGARRLLRVSSVGIVPLAALWTVSDDFLYLMGLQLLAGTMWGAFELGILLLFFESIPREVRTSTLTLFNLANATAMVAGSLVGGALLSTFGQAHEGYAILFTVSTGGRAACLLLLRGIPELGTRPVTPVLRTLAVRPSVGGIDRPVLATLPAPPEVTTDGADGRGPGSTALGEG